MKRFSLMNSLLPLIFIVTSSLGFSAVKNGAMAPDFTLKGHDGKTYKLSDFKGKHVVLEWFNNECPYVEKHYDAMNMQNLQKTYTGKGVVWLSIISSAEGKQGYRDAAGATKTMQERKASPTAVLLDPSGNVGKTYAARTTPHMYIINPEGKLVYQGAIDDKPSTSASSLEGARNYVTEALEATLANKPVKVANTKPYGCSVKYK